MWSIKYDSTELVNSTYNVSKVLDDTTAPRELNISETEGINGAVIINDRWGSKTIKIKGILIGTSPSDLQTKIDTLNELLARTEKNLDILPTGGSTRRYVARLVGSVEYDRDYYNDDYVPFTANFFVKDGVGKDTAVTTAYEELNTAVERQPASGSDDMSLVGSADPKPSIEITLDTIGKLDLLTFTNDDDSKEMSIEIDSSFATADKIIIDTDLKTVKKETGGVQTFIASSGEIPDFILGTNNFHFDFQGATEVLDAEQSTDHSDGTFTGNNGAGTKRVLAQKFIAENSGYLSALKIWGQKNGTPGTFYVDIYQDNGELPATIFGTAFASPSSDFSAAPGGEVTLTINDLKYLRKGVTYWLVFRTGDTSGNYYSLSGSGATSYYSNGKLLKYDGSVTPPTDPNDWEDYSGTVADLYFKSYRGQGGAVNWFVDYVISYVKIYL